MPVSFTPVWKDCGMLGEGPQLLVVPYEGIGLVYINGLRTPDPRHDLKFDSSDLTVSIVKPGEVSRALMSYSENFPARLRGGVQALFGGVMNSLQFGSHLVQVEGNAAGFTASLDIKGKAGAAKLDVLTARRRTVSVAFRFIHYLDDAGNVTMGTAYPPSYAGELMGVMNRLFMPSANIELTLASAKDETIMRQLGPSLSKVNFYDHIAGRRDRNADLTVFFVGKWKGGSDPLGSAFPDVQCVVLDDKPRQYIAPEKGWPPNQFTDDQINWSKDRKATDRDLHVVLAHELAHLLGAGHNDDQDNLMSNLRQDLQLSKGTARAIAGK